MNLFLLLVHITQLGSVRSFYMYLAVEKASDGFRGRLSLKTLKNVNILLLWKTISIYYAYIFFHFICFCQLVSFFIFILFNS